METITVTDVDSPAAAGKPYLIKLEDGRELATWNEDIAKEAFQNKGEEAKATIGTKVNGSFTNHYLNAINDVKDKKPARAKASSARVQAGTRDPQVQERIARQWAYGRAVELLVGSGEDFTFPLDSATLSGLSETAQ